MDSLIKEYDTDFIVSAIEQNLFDEGYKEKTVKDMSAGVKKILDASSPEKLFKLAKSENCEIEIRPFLDTVFPGLAFNKLGWYFAAVRLIVKCLRNNPDADISIPEKETEDAYENTDYFELDSWFWNGEGTAPTLKEARKIICELSENKYLREIDDEIKGVFAEAGTENRDYEAVLKKVHCVAKTFGDAYFDEESLARQIIEADVDNLIKNGDETAVEKLTEVLSDKNHKRLYFFAVKYCLAHNPEKFPFCSYGTMVALLYFRDYDGFYTFSADELLTYGKYKKLLDIFRTKYSLTGLKYREVALVLLHCGRELMD